MHPYCDKTRSNQDPMAARTALIHDKTLLESFLRRNTFLHLYELGDLDEPFWPWTTWYGLMDEGELQAVTLLYRTKET
jgi:hypothetical protein